MPNAGSQQQADPGAQQQQQGGDGGQQQQQQPQGASQEPGAAFDYDKLIEIVEGRQKATEDTVLKGYFKDQGITGEEAAQAIAAFKAQKAASAPDVAGMQGQIDGLSKQLMLAQVQNAVTAAAVQKGIDAATIPYLARMADLTQVADAEGNVDAAKVSAAIDKVLEDLPQLKPQAQQQRGFQVGGAGDPGGKPPAADDSKIRKAFGL